MATISIKGADKATILQKLYDRAKVQGMGILHAVPGPMSRELAEKLIGGTPSGDYPPGFHKPLYFDYVQGRVMKVDLSGDAFDPWLYDRDNGTGAAYAAIKDVPGVSLVQG